MWLWMPYLKGNGLTPFLELAMASFLKKGKYVTNFSFNAPFYALTQKGKILIKVGQVSNLCEKGWASIL